MSSLATFLKGLFLNGSPVVDPGPAVPSPCPDCESLLLEAYQRDSWGFPGIQPPFRVEPAQQVSVWFYTAAMIYADRSMPPDLSTQLLKPVRFEEADASAHYSADIVLRHLPALHELAVGLADGDPVLVSLREMAWNWPLSSVGIRKHGETGAPDLAAIRSHPALWRLFLDRIVSEADRSLLDDESVRSGSRNSLGLHPELAIQLISFWEDVAPPRLPLQSLSR